MLDSDDEDEEVAAVAVETGKAKNAKVTEQPVAQEHGEEELSATTKKLKLDPVTPNKPKAETLASKNQKSVSRSESKRQSLDDKAASESEDKIEADDEVQEDDIEQQDEAVEIKQAAAKW